MSEISLICSDIKLSRVKCSWRRLASLALTAHAWLNQPETRMPRAAEAAEVWSHYTCRVHCVSHSMCDICLTYAYRYNNEKICVNTNCKFSHQVVLCSYDNDLHSIIVEKSSNYDNYAVIPVLDRAKVKKKITFNSDTFVQWMFMLRPCNKNDNL